MKGETKNILVLRIPFTISMKQIDFKMPNENSFYHKYKVAIKK